MMTRKEILDFYRNLARQKFGENARAEFSENESNVVDIHTGAPSANINDISRFKTATNRECWVTADANLDIIVCVEI